MNLNSVKIKNLSSANTNKSTPNKINFDRSSQEFTNCASVLRDLDSRKDKKSQHLKYSSSVSSLNHAGE